MLRDARTCHPTVDGPKLHQSPCSNAFQTKTPIDGAQGDGVQITLRITRNLIASGRRIAGLGLPPLLVAARSPVIITPGCDRSRLRSTDPATILCAYSARAVVRLQHTGPLSAAWSKSKWIPRGGLDHRHIDSIPVPHTKAIHKPTAACAHILITALYTT